MSPIYEEEGKLTREDLHDLRKRNRCKQCHGMLNVFMDFDANKAFLACNDWPRIHHEGIEREPSQWEQKGVESLNIPTRREMMQEELGTKKATKLAKYEGVVSLTKAEAMEILKTIWPGAPEVEVLKAAMICHQYGLNPLMKHLFLIPFKRREKGIVVGEDWVAVLGINTNRLMAQRRHNYSYLDMTPRRMTEDEQGKVLGELDDTRIWAITKIRDLETSAEAMGIGSWPKDEVPYGSEKGNTKLNMASIRSERQALDRQYPGEMPQGVEVMDEQYLGGVGENHLISKGDDKTAEPPAMKLGEGKVGKTVLATGPTELEGEGFSIDLEWLKEAKQTLKWTDETMLSFIISQYKVSGNTITEVLNNLTREQAEDFTNQINKRVEKQTSLF